MGLFNDAGESERRARLKMMEDARLEFAEAMAKGGFRPEKMLLVSNERGGLVGLCRDGGALCRIVGPDFGVPGSFTLERDPAPEYRREEFFEASEGMGGFLGIGKKGAKGFYLIFNRDGVELSIPFIVNRNSAAAFSYRRNPLLSVKRRRGDANVVWDLQPLDKSTLPKVERTLDEILS